jgi:hypothetical protein
MRELIIAVVVMLALFWLASIACGRELRREADDRSHQKKAA